MPLPDALLVGKKVVFKERTQYKYPGVLVEIPKNHTLTVKEIILGDNYNGYFVYYTFNEHSSLKLGEHDLMDKIYLGTRMSEDDIMQWFGKQDRQ